MQVARTDDSPPAELAASPAAAPPARLSPRCGVWAQSIWDRRSVVHCYTRPSRSEYWHRSCGRGFGVLLEHFVEGMTATKPELGRRGAIRKCSLCEQRVSRGIVSAFGPPEIDSEGSPGDAATAPRASRAHAATQAA